MSRCIAAQVKEILGYNYGVNPDGTEPSLNTYIAMASALIDSAVPRQQAKGFNFPANMLALQEAAVAAHYYERMDPTYQSKTTGKSTAAFMRDKDNPEPFKAMAVEMDPSGVLNSLLNRKSARAAWLGKPPSSQIPYIQRS